MKKLRNIIFVINILGILILNASLQGCNSGGSTSSGTDLFSKNLESGNPTNTGVPFDGTVGYDSIHQRLALDQCFAEQRNTWYVSDNHTNSTYYYYSLNEQSIENTIETDEKVHFHDTDHMLLENSSLSGHYAIEKKLENNWSMYGINIFGYGEQKYTVGYSTASINQLSAILNHQGIDTLNNAASLYPTDLTKQYEYFAVHCGDHMINSWEYKQFIVAQFVVNSSSLEMEKSLKKQLAVSGSGNAGVLSVGVSGDNGGSYDMSKILKDAANNTHYSYYSFGTGNQASTSPEACDSTSQQNCFAQIIDPFFKLVYNWKQANPRTSSSSYLSNQPIPGSQYLPASQWTGNFSTYSIANMLINHLEAESGGYLKIPTEINNPQMFRYATTIRLVNAEYNKLEKMLVLFNNLHQTNYCASHEFSGAVSCKTTLSAAIRSLTGYLKEVEHSNHNKRGEIYNYCFDGFYETGDPDSNKCLEAITRYQDSTYIPYATLLKFQDNSQQIYLTRNYPDGDDADLVYDANNLSTDDKNIGVYKFSRGDSSKSSWGGNKLTPQYLVSDAGDYVSTFINGDNSPYNIYIANGTSSNSLYVVPGWYTTPLNTQNLNVTRVNQSLVDLDGNFEIGGDFKLYENLDNLMPGSYIYARCPESICMNGLKGYLVIVDNNTNLYEYEVYGRNYDLYQIWSAVNNKLNNNGDKIVNFNTSTGIFGIYNEIAPNSNDNLYFYNPYSENSQIPKDGVRRFALKLNSQTGVLEIYKNHDDSPVWSNINEIVPMPGHASNPNIPTNSFWYRYQDESSESAE